MDLALHNHGIDDGAEIVHGGEAVQLHDPSRRIHLDFGNIGAGGEGEVGGVVERCFIQPRLEFVERVVVWHIGGQGHLSKGDFFVRAFDIEFAIGKLNIGIGCLHQMGRNLFRLGFNFVKGAHDGGPTDRDRA